MKNVLTLAFDYLRVSVYLRVARVNIKELVLVVWMNVKGFVLLSQELGWMLNGFFFQFWITNLTNLTDYRFVGLPFGECKWPFQTALPSERKFCFSVSYLWLLGSGHMRVPGVTQTARCHGTQTLGVTLDVLPPNLQPPPPPRPLFPESPSASAPTHN